MRQAGHDSREAQLDPGYERHLRDRFAWVREQVELACARSSREPSEVEVVCVSKTVGTSEVLAAFEAGFTHFAENRPQELVRKLEELQDAPELEQMTFDMIGNLQTNKINQVLGRARMIHSVSSEHLAQAVSKRALVRDLRVPCLLEVNVSGEKSKGGMTPDECREAAERIAALDGLDVQGLMTMAPKGDADAARRTFCGLRELADDLTARTGLDLPRISCGMSDDFVIAVEEGSTLIRLGRVVFSQDYEVR